MATSSPSPNLSPSPKSSPNFSPVAVPSISGDPPSQSRRRLSPDATSPSESPDPSPPPEQLVDSPPPPTSPPSPSAPPSPPAAEPPSSPPESSPAPDSPDSPGRSPPSPPPSPPRSSPPPPSPSPPATSPPRPASSPPPSSPPPSPDPPATSPPVPSSSPPSSSPPPPLVPPGKSPPTPQPQPPASLPPQISPSPSTLVPPSNSTPPTIFNPPPSLSPPSLEPPTNSSPPVIAAPPPPFTGSPPSPSQVLVPPSGPNNTDSSPNTRSDGGGISTGGIVAISIALGFVLLGVIGTAIWCVIKRKRKRYGSNMPTSVGTSPTSDSSFLNLEASASQNGKRHANGFQYTPLEPGGLGNSRSWFSYDELVDATNGFSEHNILGSGGFGSVYKGCLADGREVAIKQLKVGGGQGEREFRAEVEIISRIHHRHLVSLVGYCISENKRLLVYEYVPNNTLYFHLHGSEVVLDWATRVKVAAGAARGIAYLHEDCHPRIIHRDIKSSNILLDKNFDARVADFGLAKLAADAFSHITTRVMGTFGYMAPEYASTGKLTEKSDIFSFGVVLLELITGRKPVDASQPLGEESLVEWARPLLSHALETEDFQELVDPRLGMNFVGIEMFRMIEAAASCVRHSASKRPRMVQIVRAFESIGTDDLSNGMRVGESEMFNAAQQSAELRLFQRMAFGSQDFSTDFFTQGSLNSHDR